MKIADLLENRTLTADQVKDRNADEAQRLSKKMIASLKKSGIRVAQTNVDIVSGKHVITIENSEGGAKNGPSVEMEEIVRASKIAQFISREEHEGQFDWKADTYIKPVSMVWFKF